MTDKTLEVKKLTKYYGAVRAIDNISFSVEKGKVLGFLGPNGAGKSTTLKIISGLIPATSGEAFVCGFSVARDPMEVKKRIGYMPENNPLAEELKVVEYLRYRANLKGVPYREVKNRVNEVLEICDLHHKAHNRVIGTLSKGFRQRVGIADVILAKPEVVIMDEPTIGLDPHQVHSIRKLLDQLKGEHTIIISSHILPEIEASCNQIIIINHGHVVAAGDTQDLRREFLPYAYYELEVCCEMAEFARELEQAFPHFTIEESSHGNETSFRNILLQTKEDKDQGESLIRWIHEKSKWTLRSLTRKQPSLENVFMAATKRSWEERMGPIWHEKNHEARTHPVSESATTQDTSTE